MKVLTANYWCKIPAGSLERGRTFLQVPQKHQRNIQEQQLRSKLVSEKGRGVTLRREMVPRTSQKFFACLGRFWIRISIQRTSESLWKSLKTSEKFLEAVPFCAVPLCISAIVSNLVEVSQISSEVACTLVPVWSRPCQHHGLCTPRTMDLETPLPLQPCLLNHRCCILGLQQNDAFSWIKMKLQHLARAVSDSGRGIWGSPTWIRGQETINSNSFMGCSRMGGQKFCLWGFLLWEGGASSWGQKETHQQNLKHQGNSGWEIPGQSQDNLGIILWRSEQKMCH